MPQDGSRAQNSGDYFFVVLNNVGRKAGLGVKITGLIPGSAVYLLWSILGQDREMFPLIKWGNTIYLAAEKSNENVCENSIN